MDECVCISDHLDTVGIKVQAFGIWRFCCTFSLPDIHLCQITSNLPGLPNTWGRGFKSMPLLKWSDCMRPEYSRQMMMSVCSGVISSEGATV